jgi:hypothetical protein
MMLLPFTIVVVVFEALRRSGTLTFEKDSREGAATALERERAGGTSESNR